MKENAIVTNPVKVIRLKCLDCCCGNSNEVKECTVTRCPLHPFRFGKNPYRVKNDLSAEERREIGERLKRGRLSK